MENSQIAHLWANKSRKSASGSNFFFEDDIIFSYGRHFPIARHYKGVVLMTTGGYSMSTSRHIGIVRGAVTHLTVFSVPKPLEDPSGTDVKAYAASIAMSAKIARMRKPSGWDMGRLNSMVDEANLFCKTFGFKTRFAMPTNLGELQARAKAEAAKNRVAKAKAAAKLEREQAATIARWIAGEKVNVPGGISKVYLRAVTNASTRDTDGVLQTSRGACVPLVDAQKAFRFIMLKRAAGWHRNGETFRVGEFQLDTVNDQGVVAGCHRIEWEEIERFAKVQGWL